MIEQKTECVACDTLRFFVWQFLSQYQALGYAPFILSLSYARFLRSRMNPIALTAIRAG